MSLEGIKSWHRDFSFTKIRECELELGIRILTTKLFPKLCNISPGQVRIRTSQAEPNKANLI